MSKYLGKTYGVWWKVVGRKHVSHHSHCHYVLVNQANGAQIIIQDNTMRKIAKGETTISKTIHHNIKLNQLKGEKAK